MFEKPLFYSKIMDQMNFVTFVKQHAKLKRPSDLLDSFENKTYLYQSVIDNNLFTLNFKL